MFMSDCQIQGTTKALAREKKLFSDLVRTNKLKIEKKQELQLTLSSMLKISNVIKRVK